MGAIWMWQVFSWSGSWDSSILGFSGTSVGHLELCNHSVRGPPTLEHKSPQLLILQIASLLQHAVAIRSSMEWSDDTSLVTMQLFILLIARHNANEEIVAQTSQSAWCSTFLPTIASSHQDRDSPNMQDSNLMSMIWFSERMHSNQLSNSNLILSMRMHVVSRKICYLLIRYRPLFSDFHSSGRPNHLFRLASSFFAVRWSQESASHFSTLA